MAKKAPDLDISALETWLWDAACQIRGPVDAPKYKDYILPLVFLKRLSDVFEDEVRGLAEKYENEAMARKVVEADHSLVRFFIPPDARWEHVNKITSGLGEALTDAVRAVSRENPKLAGVIDVTDFNATTAGQRIVGDEQLHQLVQVLNKYRLGLKDVEPDILGRAYEYLLRKFAEGQGQSAGEFYTPRMVGVLMARLLDPQPGMTVYDPACGSGGLLVKGHLRLLDKQGVQKNGRTVLPREVEPLQIFGQEINPSTFAMARMNAFIHDIEAEIALGDTMRNPRFTTEAGGLRQFDLVTANPMWNQNFPQEIYENDPYERFHFGTPPTSSADWGWLQHMLASLNDKGRMAVVLDTGSVSRGSGQQGSNRERDIRKHFVEEDLIEAVILLPDNLFYNMTGPGIIMVLNREKSHPQELLLIRASHLFVKGKPKNELTETHIENITDIYQKWHSQEGLSTIVEISEVMSSDFNLSPSRYVSSDNEEGILPLEDVMVLLAEAEDQRAKADIRLKKSLQKLGLTGWTSDGNA